MVACPEAEVRLYGPLSPCSAAPRSQSARSRTSTYWRGSSRGPGASTGPPRAIRFSHQGSRPTFSYGPMISPARASTERSGPKASRTASSPPRLSWAYSVCPASAEASATTGASSVDPAGGAHAYTERLDTYTYRPTRSRSSRAVSRTALGAADQVSMTTSHSSSPARAASPSGAVRSPCSDRAPSGAGCRPRWKTVTSQPRSSAASTTGRPTNSVPPSIRSLMPVTLPARGSGGNRALPSAEAR